MLNGKWLWRRGFAFLVDAYGLASTTVEIAALSLGADSDQSNFEFEIEEEQLTADPGHILFLPVILKAP